MDNIYQAVYDTLSEGTESLEEQKKRLKTLEEKIDSGRYSSVALQQDVYPMRDKLKRSINDEADKILDNARNMIAEHEEELRKLDVLNPSDITDDVKLFNSGIVLNANDIKGILERNKENRTMTQIALRYAEQHNIEMDVTYNKSIYAIRELDGLKDAVSRYRQWIVRENASEILNKFFGVE